MKIGITGHQELADPLWVKQEIFRFLASQPQPLIGITSLAVGADQLFAQAILDSAGELRVIVPFEDYSEVFKQEGRSEYNRLLSLASDIEILVAEKSHEEAYLAAGKRVVDLSDVVIAVWNGKPAAGLGGTADIVEYTKSSKKNYIHINPVTQQIASFL